MADFLPVAFHQLKPLSQSESSTSFCRIVKEFHIGTARSYPVVCLAFDNDQPLGLSPDQAVEVSEGLIEQVKKLEGRRSLPTH
jgi:hypothetical protein